MKYLQARPVLAGTPRDIPELVTSVQPCGMRADMPGCRLSTALTLVTVRIAARITLASALGSSCAAGCSCETASGASCAILRSQRSAQRTRTKPSLCYHREIHIHTLSYNTFAFQISLPGGQEQRDGGGAIGSSASTLPRGRTGSRALRGVQASSGPALADPASLHAVRGGGGLRAPSPLLPAYPG